MRLRWRRRPSPIRAAAPRITSPEQLGALVFGPALFAFMVWLVRHPATIRLDRLYFASREGWLLQQLYEVLREQGGREQGGIGALPPGIYLPCSRRALLAAQLGATLARGGGLDVGLLTASSRWFEGTVEQLLLARIGFTPSRPGASSAARVALMQDAEIVHCVADLLSCEIAPHVRAAHAGFLSYAAGIGLAPGGRGGLVPRGGAGMAPRGGAGIVDVGYSATMQSAIQNTLGIRLVGFYMAVTEAARQVAAGGGYAFGAFAQGEAASGFGAEFGLLLEAVLTAPHGQVTGYTPGRYAGMRPPAPIFADNASDFATLHRIHAGILDHCRSRLATHGLHPEADPLRMLRRLGSGAISVAPAIAAALRVEDGFCGNGEIDVLARLRGSLNA